jgi:hypothetical protein
MKAPRAEPSNELEPSGHLAAAGRFWEPLRIIYNSLLAVIVFIWLVASWPHFRPAMTMPNLLRLLGLAAIANVCYTAAYFVDIPLQSVLRQRSLQGMRRALWMAGMLLAILVTNYWIADEIYPYVS